MPPMPPSKCTQQHVSSASLSYPTHPHFRPPIMYRAPTEMMKIKLSLSHTFHSNQLILQPQHAEHQDSNEKEGEKKQHCQESRNSYEDKNDGLTPCSLLCSSHIFPRCNSWLPACGSWICGCYERVTSSEYMHA